MLTQEEAGEYIAERKRFAEQTEIPIPPGVKSVYDLIGTDGNNVYLLDVHRGVLKLSRVMLQNRVRVAMVLMRVDLNGRPHTNPDQQVLNGSHIHLYREGYEDKWAKPLDPSVFQDENDISQVFRDFCSFCNIDNNNINIQVGML